MSQQWNQLNEMDQINLIKEESNHQPVLIFKHSTTCGISHSAKNTLENQLNDLGEQFSLYYLDLLQHREISTAIAHEFGVIHQSPQVLVISNQKCVYHSSHYAIKPQSILELNAS